MKKNVMLIALMMVSTFIFALRKPNHGRANDDYKKIIDRADRLKEIAVADGRAVCESKIDQ